MLSLTTKRHAIFICIPGISGSGNDNYAGYGMVIDAVADRLLELSSNDPELALYLDACLDRMDGYQKIAMHLDKAIQDHRWLLTCASTELCRFVFDRLQPDFEKKEFAVNEQIAQARQVIEQCRYAVPAVVTRTRLYEDKITYGFRFQAGVKVGDVLTNTDRTQSRVMAVVEQA